MKSYYLSLFLFISLFSSCKKDEENQIINNTENSNNVNNTVYTFELTIDGVTQSFEVGNNLGQHLYSSEIMLGGSSVYLTPATSVSQISVDGSQNSGYIYIRLPTRYFAASLWNNNPNQAFIDYFNESFNVFLGDDADLSVLNPNGDSWTLVSQPDPDDWIDSLEILQSSPLAVVRCYGDLIVALRNASTNEIVAAQLNYSMKFQQPV